MEGGSFSLVDDPPVLLTLGSELVVERGGTAVDPVGRGGAVIVAQAAAVRQVQHGPPLEGLQARRGDEARDRHCLLVELRTTSR